MYVVVYVRVCLFAGVFPCVFNHLQLDDILESAEFSFNYFNLVCKRVLFIVTVLHCYLNITR